MKAGFVDIHQHLLWGMDDGAESRQVMLEMLNHAREQQIRYICATSHAMPGIRPFDLCRYEQRLAEAQEICDKNRWPIRILPGSEVAWTFNTVNALKQGRIPTLNHSDYVLLEFWPSVRWYELEDAVRQTLCAGFVPILAHVERYRCFFWNPRQAAVMKQRYPLFYQVNTSSILGGEGFLRRRCTGELLKRRLVDAVATDAHNCTVRPPQMLEVYQRLKTEYDADYADALTHFHEVFSG